MTEFAAGWLDAVEASLSKAGAELVDETRVRNVKNYFTDALANVELDEQALALFESSLNSATAFLAGRCWNFDILAGTRPINTTLQSRAWADFRAFKAKMTALPPSAMAVSLGLG